MRRHLYMAVLATLILTLFALVACGTTPLSSLDGQAGLAPGTAEAGTAEQTQVQINADNQAVATAEIVRANAQATLNSAIATLSAAQTQEQNNANAIAAQIGATAEFDRANAQATLVAAGSTQSAALTQDALRQTQTQYDLQVNQAAGTQSAEALLIQQNKNDLAAGTQTGVANNIATQTRAAAATSQWYADQSRQRQQSSLNFIWVWCLPVFLVLIAALLVWGFFRWLKVRPAYQPNPENPADKTIPPAAPVSPQRPEDLPPHPEGEDTNRRYRLTRPSDQVGRWLEEVKRKLRRSDEKDENDTPDE